MGVNVSIKHEPCDFFGELTKNRSLRLEKQPFSLPYHYRYTGPMTLPLTALDWLTAPPLFTQPADALPWLLPQHFTAQEQTGPHKDQRLGRRFEAFLFQQIAHQPELKLVWRNKPITDDKRTLGELDALLYHRTLNEYWHWEFTFKHYLGVREDYWPGPNPKDHFQRKYLHGLNHQFPLIQHPETQAQLPGAVAQQNLISRGVLYYPADQYLAPPVGAHPHHLRGIWWTESNLPKTNNYVIIPKYYWLNAQSLLDPMPQWLTAEAIIQYLHQVNCPTLLITKHATQGFTPGFIVPNSWLAHVYK